MTLHADWTGDRCRLRIEDDLTIYAAALLKPQLLDALSRAADLEVDLAEVGEIDSAGLQLLVLVKREAASGGKQVRLTCHSPAVIKLFDLYNMVGYFGDPLVIPAA